MTVFSNMVVGDILYCHNSVVMEYTEEIRCVRGKYYTITSVSDEYFNILNDYGCRHQFDHTGERYDTSKWFTPHNSLTPRKCLKKTLFIDNRLPR